MKKHILCLISDSVSLNGYLIFIILLFISIQFYNFFIRPHICQAVEVAGGGINEATAFYKNKEYSKSFPIFKKYCLEYNDTYACFMTGISYRFGERVNKNIFMAKEIFSSPMLIDDPKCDVTACLYL